jgi:hypothetical protein
VALTFVNGKPKKVVKSEDDQTPYAKAVYGTAPVGEPVPAAAFHEQADAGNATLLAAEGAAILAQGEAVAKTKSSVVTEEANSEVLTMVDRYTELQAIIDAADVSAEIKEQEGIKKQLQSIAKSDQFPAHKKVQLYGTHSNYVEFSEQANSTKISNKQGLINAIGLDKYVELTDITLTNAKKVLSESELEKYTTNVPGARTLKSVHKGD